MQCLVDYVEVDRQIRGRVWELHKYLPAICRSVDIVHMTRVYTANVDECCG